MELRSLVREVGRAALAGASRRGRTTAREHRGCKGAGQRVHRQAHGSQHCTSTPAEAQAEGQGQGCAEEAARAKPESLEAALVAGPACKKCLPTQMGTKGCRACMGVWFEHIRQRAHNP